MAKLPVSPHDHDKFAAVTAIIWTVSAAMFLLALVGLCALVGSVLLWLAL